MFLVDWAVKMRIRPPEFETSICDAKYHVSLSTRSVLGKCVYLVTLAMSLFDLQDVCIAIGSIATLDLSMVVDLIGIYGLKGPYCTLTTTDWFFQALSVIPRGSWGDVTRRFTMIRWAGSSHKLAGQSSASTSRVPYCSPYWVLTPCPSGAWLFSLLCCFQETQVLQLVVVLAQLVVPQEVVRVSQWRIAYLYLSVFLARGMPCALSLYPVVGV
ncbi:hypothetical protein F511_15403 [Dorcoceras hygrometricum]|uniref:Uncharacterized protein n=1 Tax=Dorcoceras hygrometricum TaxID=472368 RepID=A0A2Z7D3U9_9LAMI|nr:hypothetical protein F511_15403 [Dorcoceras hygrometricum]